MIKELEELIARARKVALKSPCPKAKFGSLIVVDGKVVAEGYNKPPAWPGNDCAKHCLRRGVASGTQLERCYALHSEQWAILNALKQGYNLSKALLVVAGYDSQGKEWEKEKPSFYCTFCSRWVLACGFSGILIDTINGPYVMTPSEVWTTSYQTAEGKITSAGLPIKTEE